MSNFLLIFICLGLGMLLQRVQEIPESMARSLNLYVIYGALPALILVQIPTIGLSFELLVPVLMPWFLLICGVLLIGLGWKLFGWPSATVGCLLLCVPLGNTSFLGIPMVTAFFGEEQVPYAIIYDQLGSFIALSTYGAVVLAGFQHGKIPGVMLQSKGFDQGFRQFIQGKLPQIMNPLLKCLWQKFIQGKRSVEKLFAIRYPDGTRKIAVVFQECVVQDISGVNQVF
jgi:predicted permease